MKPRVLVLRAAGSNCDHETAYAFEQAGAEVTQLHVNRVLEREGDALAEFDALAVPGGFTYGDDLGAGQILGLVLERRLKPSIEALVARGGLVLGICNGFQALVRAGLLPGTPALQASLAPNASGRFECHWTRLEVTAPSSPWLRGIETLDLPIAHAEGRLVFAADADPEAIQALAALRYLKPTDGDPGVAGSAGSSPADYPANPAGSTADLAGLVDPTGQILGLMPHPERNVEPYHAPGWTRRTGAGASESGAGRQLFTNAVETLRG
ncbi:MAG: phosphoribosylformylglycinamidine synthase subunit PurQ [Planctomycetes bacterium]|nr:phosphoribosylformylglycinamidine synthase subunit PurQ [Planctomycetota bacterium]